MRIILTQAQPYANHNGGQLAFGPDGLLYVGLGDGGSGGDPQRHGQNPGDFLGSILRVDIRTPDGYTIPPDNPFADGAGGAPEVWAYGLRNPWRFSFDGDLLYIADVGQNRVEEVDVVDATTAAGSNFGWNVMEGGTCYASGEACSGADRGFVDPVYTYDHSGDRCSITGGYVYRGSAYPGLFGTYLFADYCTGRGPGAEDGRRRGHRVPELRPARGAAPASFGTDSEGNIYIVDLIASARSRGSSRPEATRSRPRGHRHADDDEHVADAERVRERKRRRPREDVAEPRQNGVLEHGGVGETRVRGRFPQMPRRPRSRAAPLR